MAMIQGFEEDLRPLSYLVNVASKRKALDDLEEEASRRVAQRTSEPASSSTENPKDKKKRRRDFVEQLREATKKMKVPRPTTRSMTRAATRDTDDSENVPVEQEQDNPGHREEAARHWMDDLEEHIPNHEPTPQERQQPDASDEQEAVPQHEHRPQQRNYHEHVEETPYVPRAGQQHDQ